MPRPRPATAAKPGHPSTACQRRLPRWAFVARSIPLLSCLGHVELGACLLRRGAVGGHADRARRGRPAVPRHPCEPRLAVRSPPRPAPLAFNPSRCTARRLRGEDITPRRPWRPMQARERPRTWSTLAGEHEVPLLEVAPASEDVGEGQHRFGARAAVSIHSTRARAEAASPLRRWRLRHYARQQSLALGCESVVGTHAVGCLFGVADHPRPVVRSGGRPGRAGLRHV